MLIDELIKREKQRERIALYGWFFDFCKKNSKSQEDNSDGKHTVYFAHQDFVKILQYETASVDCKARIIKDLAEECQILRVHFDKDFSEDDILKQLDWVCKSTTFHPYMVGVCDSKTFRHFLIHRNNNSYLDIDLNISAKTITEHINFYGFVIYRFSMFNLLNQ